MQETELMNLPLINGGLENEVFQHGSIGDFLTSNLEGKKFCF